MAKVFSYIRFSSAPQERGDSLRRQKTLGDAWLQRHPEHTLDTSLKLRDLGVSAFKGANLDPKTGDLGKFIFLAEKGDIPEHSILMLEHLDRFSRDEAWLALNVLTNLLKARIRILTLEPERLIDRSNAGKMEVLLPAVLDLIIAHEQSERKSRLVGKAWRQKQLDAPHKKLTKVCPAWLRLSTDRTEFELIPHAVATVRDIFKWTVEGIGVTAILRRLISEDRPVIGRRKNSGEWHRSYILKILHNRAVLGEYQPHEGHVGNRKPRGDVVPNYYPAIVKPALFYQAQRALAQRKLVRSPSIDKVVSLFTRVARDARDGSTLTVVDKGDGPRLVSSAAHRGRKGAVYCSMSYVHFEKAFLRFTSELQAEDILPSSPNTNKLQQLLEEEEGKLGELRHQLSRLQTALRGRNVAAVIDEMERLEAEISHKSSAVEGLKGAMAQAKGQALDTIQDVTKLLERATGDERLTLRRRLKEQIRNLVSEIWVLVHDQKRSIERVKMGGKWVNLEKRAERSCIVQVHFVSGGSRWFAFSYHPRDTLLTVFGQSIVGPVAGVDLRGYPEWTARQKASVTDYLEDKSHDKVEVIRVA